MKTKLNKLKNYLLKLIYPNHIKCIFCGDELNQNSYNDICEVCLKELPYITTCCGKCGNPIHEDDTGVCESCKITNYDFIWARAVFEYKDKVLTSVHKFKYSGGKYLFSPFAKLMATKYATENLFADVVTFVPMYKTKEKKRGYNQAKLLAEEFCKLTKLECVDIIEKVVDNSAQASLNFKERRENVKDIFKVNPELKHKIKGKSVLLIDDIFTTGATANEICKMLINAGADKCYVLTLAHTNFKDIKN